MFLCGETDCYLLNSGGRCIIGGCKEMTTQVKKAAMSEEIERDQVKEEICGIER